MFKSHKKAVGFDPTIIYGHLNVNILFNWRKGCTGKKTASKKTKEPNKEKLHPEENQPKYPSRRVQSGKVCPVPTTNKSAHRSHVRIALLY